jgi:putative heme-binding domain-containing protein
MSNKIQAFVFLLLPLLVKAQTSNPLDGDITAIRLGHALYDARCATCHGADAKGIVAPDLTLLWATTEDDARVFQILRNGVAGSIMPPSASPDTELWSIVAFLKSISTVPEPVAGEGNAQQGEELFTRHCSDCHRFNGIGGSLGPDLSRISSIRSREALTQSLRIPDASVNSGYQVLSLVMADGSRIQGLLKNEDAFSLQIMTTTQSLMGIRKSELQEIRREAGSLMPAFTVDQLNDSGLNDLLYYLRNPGSNRAN